jgi:lysophospholipase L1-like esterase
VIALAWGGALAACGDADVSLDLDGSADEAGVTADGAAQDSSIATDATVASADASKHGGDAATAVDAADATDAANAADGGDAVDAAGGGDDAGDAGVDAGMPMDAGHDAGPPAVRLVGRFDTSVAGKAVTQWPGGRILANFQGTDAKVTFSDHTTVGEHGYWDVTVDGALSPTPIKMVEGVSTYTVASGLADATHTLELFRRTEPYVDSVTFMGFDFGAGALLPPDLAPDRRLEFLGDSASNGYGIDGAGPNCGFTAAQENDHETYPWLTAKALMADHHNLSFQGRGVYWNYTRNDPTHFDTLYTRTLPLNPGSMWSYASYEPQVIWITLGGNDYDQPNAGDPAPPFASFKSSYDTLVTEVRNAHPGAIIVCSVAPSLNDGYPPGYKAYTNVSTALTQVVSARNAGGDANVYYFEFTRSVSADLTACNYHPNPAKHAKMAVEATAFIKSKTGW